VRDDQEPDPQPAPTFHLDRASRRTEAEREEHFLFWWLKYGEPYQAAVIAANGDTPWTTDLDERRELFARRYERPEPPKGLSSPRFRERDS
jgi:hypothetical protein